MLCVVKTEVFGKGSPDKNGLMPVILVPVAGKIPAKFVLSGTVAKSNGFQVGKTYLTQWVAGKVDEQYGQTYNYKCLAEIDDPIQIIELMHRLGDAEVLKEKEVEVTETKSDFDL